MRLKHAGSWCERRDLNPHGCPPDPKSGASAIPPLSHSAGGSIFGKQQYIHIFPLGKPKRPPEENPSPMLPARRNSALWPFDPPRTPKSAVAGVRGPGGRRGVPQGGTVLYRLG